MPKLNVSIIGGSGYVSADTAASPNTLPLKDNGGGLTLGPSTINGVTNTGADVAPVVSLTGTATLTNASGLVFANATSSAFTITLPAAALSAYQKLTIIKTDSASHTVTIAGAGSDNINGASTYTSLTAQYNQVTLISDGTQWYAK